MSNEVLVEFEDLHVNFPTIGKPVEAVRGVTFHINKGETVGVVGESGSGKSVSAMSLLRLNDMAGAYMPKGRITLHSQERGRVDITEADEPLMQSIRGSEIAMIFQEPMTCLNPVLSIRTQLSEPLLQHQGMDASQAEEVALSLLKRVRIPDPEKKLDQYPHHLSGGMRQRAMIAMALCCKPSLLIADEPTTALDVTIQAQILDLIKDLQAEFGMSVMFITHDFGVVAEIANRVCVMRHGKIVELGDAKSVLENPQDAYTQALIAAIPSNAVPPHRETSQVAPLLEIKQLNKVFRSRGGFLKPSREVRALEDVSLTLARGETVGIVGESGSGKSTLGRCVVRLEHPDSGALLLERKHLCSGVYPPITAGTGTSSPARGRRAPSVASCSGSAPWRRRCCRAASPRAPS